MKFLFAFFLLQICTSCYSPKPYYSKPISSKSEITGSNDVVSYRVYLIGDVGSAQTDPPERTLEILRDKIMSEPEAKSAVIFLGDNLYPQGLHSKEHPDRAQDEIFLNKQISAVKGYKGRVVFIPGNHDWKEGKKDGFRFIKRQEDYIEDALGGKKTFLPNGGCPGPEVITLDENKRLIVLDTQWWLHKHKRAEGERYNCDVSDEVEFANLLKDELRRNMEMEVLVVGHHPLISSGNHGGDYTFKDHLFPLTNVRRNLFIPLPVIGSIYPLYRKVLGSHQDVAHPKYRSLIRTLMPLFEDHPGLIYASGHEHNLQYTSKNNVHYVVSGSGCKTSYLKRGKPLEFGQSAKGFSRISYYKNGDIWLEYYIEHEVDPIYSTQLRVGEKSNRKVSTNTQFKSYAGVTTKAIPFEKYRAGSFKRTIFGSLHRDSWTTEIEVPVLDINFVHGGLTPIKKGGGMQTKSLRMQGGDGKQYVLRTIQKDATSLVSRELRNTLTQDVLLDGLAASHPYAALVVPPIADAVKVYHTNPKLVVVPDDASLGDYALEFGNKLCLFEERPDGDMSDIASFGNSADVVGSSDVIENLQKSYKYQVSDVAMLRARLLDILLADWDRHDDQWRWASFKTSDGVIYKPIPRDRDQVFFYQDGIVPNLSNRQWAVRKFQSFKPEIRDMIGQNFNARYVDRAYLTALEKSDWIAVADSMIAELSDEVLESGINRLPKEGLEIEGTYLLETLKQRRDALNKFALEHYAILAREVNVPGTEKDEFFEVTRMEEGKTEVNVFPRKDGKPDRDHLIYARVFDYKETHEINLYGLGGNDEYKIKGDARKGSVVRVIAGLDKDKIDAQSSVRGAARNTFIYDNIEKKGKSKIKSGSEAKVKLFKKSQFVGYDREEQKFNKTMPLVWLGFNPDDGLYLGGGFKHTHQGWKRDPYKYVVDLKGNYAAKSGAFNFDLKWDYPELLGNWDVSGELEVKAPEFNFNYYGLGNESIRLENAEDEYALRLNQIDFSPQFRRSEKGMHYFAVGPVFQYVNLSDENSRIYQLVDTLPDPADIKDRFFGGAGIEYLLENKDNDANPQRGIMFRANATYLNDLIDGDVSFVKMQTDLRLYLPVTLSPATTVLALRAGSSVNFGDSEFYQSNFVGGLEQVRGLRRNRFGGESSFYSSAELRVNLFQWFNYVLPMNFGIMAFSDQGRVWHDGENSKKMHHSVGGGIFVNPLNSVVINASYAVSDDDETVNVQLGFFF